MGILSVLFKLLSKRGSAHASTLSDLYKLRRDIVESRQKSYLKQYDELHKLFTSLCVCERP